MDTKTISMAASELNWNDVGIDAKDAGFSNVSSYVQYCVEYFHNRKRFKNVKFVEILMLIILAVVTLLLALIYMRV